MEEQKTIAELKLHSSRHVRALLIIAGTICTAIGLVGIVLPLLPTTPFLLLAAICFARSSDRFYNALMDNRYFGPPLKEWRDYQSVSKKNKRVAVAVIACSFAATITFAVSTPLARGILMAMAAVLIIIVIMLPTRAHAA